MQYEISDIAKIIGARRVGNVEHEINWLLIDSRSLCFPEETLFYAMKTQKNDGHKYINELYKRGVRNFVVENNNDFVKNEEWKNMGDANFLFVDSSLRALQQLAAYHRSQLNIPIIAITGSNGKTTVKEWLYQLLSVDYNVCRSPRSYNSQVGVPLSIWLISNHNDFAIIEAGISEMGEMEKIESIVKPTIGVITNVGAAHQENFISYDIKCSEKMQLFKNCKNVVLNMTDQTIKHCAAVIPHAVNQFTWKAAED
nr:bifunctional UDP-N-acetylmuramoyl-tripeptide:D-alanyl-D-alanine ligase/alanine racemase [Bacteroidaceae bacterium]